jgi:acetyl esterase
MQNKRLVKKALRLQFIMKLASKLKSAKIGKERFINTSHGDIKVLEYGFDSSEIEPLFIDMHGGGFVLGWAAMDEPMCVYFREQTDVKIISIDYPKAPKNPYPAAVEAIYEIIKHYADNAQTYKINPDSIGIGGHSAGGNFAAVMCIIAKEKGDFSFKYQVLDYPPCDMSINAFDKPNPKGAISPKMADMFDTCYHGKNIEAAKSPYISPIYAAKEQLSGLPPALLIVAGRDSLHDEGVHYGNLLKEAGVCVEFHDFTDSVHGFTYNKTPDAKKGWSIIAEFIKKYKC